MSDLPLCERIYLEGNWRVVHSYNTSLEGWLCLVHEKKIATLAEMTQEDAAILGQLIRRVSGAVQSVTGAVKTYLMQFADSTEHPYVHFHIVPRMADLPPDRRGPSSMFYIGVPEEQMVALERRNAIAVQVRDYLLSNP